MATLIAGEYWVIYRLSGLSLGTHPFEVGRFMLVTLNVIPLAIYFLLLASLVERLGKSDWGRIFVMTAAVFATFLTTFAVVLTNHVQGAVCVMVALWAAVPIWFDGERRWPYFALAGLSSALLVADELPGLSLAVALGLALLWKAPRPAILAWLPACALVAAAFFGTNWIAHHSLRLPYAPTRGPTTGTITPTKSATGRSRAIGTIPRESTWARSRRRSTPCTPWSATTASSR